MHRKEILGLSSSHTPCHSQKKTSVDYRQKTNNIITLIFLNETPLRQMENLNSLIIPSFPKSENPCHKGRWGRESEREIENDKLRGGMNEQRGQRWALLLTFLLLSSMGSALITRWSRYWSRTDFALPSFLFSDFFLLHSLHKKSGYASWNSSLFPLSPLQFR